jgi:hypothetical protein
MDHESIPSSVFFLVARWHGEFRVVAAGTGRGLTDDSLRSAGLPNGRHFAHSDRGARSCDHADSFDRNGL